VSGRDRGSMAIEMAIAMPLLLTLLIAAMVAGRTANAVSAVEMAAYDGARAASLARDAETARADATASVTASLARQGHGCVDPPRVEVSAIPENAWQVPAGTPASVTVLVACRVSYLDIAGSGRPAARTVTREFVSPLDQFRARP
jgi:Flp pilus assembly protein TadG